MKKTILLVALLLAAPAMAAVQLSCSVNTTADTLTISYNASTEAELVRAFALDVVATGATIQSVASTNPAYYIYPGTIVIDANGTPTNWGSPIAPGTDPGALGNLPGTQCTIEMGSLYEDANLAPAKTGTVIVLNLSGMAASGSVLVTTNETRGMIVLEDATSVDANTTCLWAPPSDPNIGTCWDLAKCPGQTLGDAQCDGKVTALDLLALKNSWLKSKGQTGYNCCADFNHDKKVSALDLLIIKNNWLRSGLGGTATLSCPP